MQKTFIITKIVTLTCNYTILGSSIQYFEVWNWISELVTGRGILAQGSISHNQTFGDAQI